MSDQGPVDAATAVANAHVFFEHNSGWAPPDHETLVEWVTDGVCRCPDECLVAPQAWCEHGLASWWLVLDALGDVEVPPLSGSTRPPTPAPPPPLTPLPPLTPTLPARRSRAASDGS